MNASEKAIDDLEERKARKRGQERETPSQAIAGFIIVSDSSFAIDVAKQHKKKTDFVLHVNCAPELKLAPSFHTETVSVKYKGNSWPVLKIFSSLR